MAHPEDEDNYPEEEAQRRYEALLRAALRTPHKPLKTLPRKRDKPSERESASKKPGAQKPTD